MQSTMENGCRAVGGCVVFGAGDIDQLRPT